jgi:hypothetical protein
MDVSRSETSTCARVPFLNKTVQHYTLSHMAGKTLNSILSAAFNIHNGKQVTLVFVVGQALGAP